MAITAWRAAMAFRRAYKYPYPSGGGGGMRSHSFPVSPSGGLTTVWYNRAGNLSFHSFCRTTHWAICPYFYQSTPQSYFGLPRVSCFVDASQGHWSAWSSVLVRILAIYSKISPHLHWHKFEALSTCGVAIIPFEVKWCLSTCPVFFL